MPSRTASALAPGEISVMKGLAQKKPSALMTQEKASMKREA